MSSRLFRVEDLFDEEAGGRIEPIAERVFGDGKNLVGPLEVEFGRQEAQILLVFADPVRQHLEGK